MDLQELLRTKRAELEAVIEREKALRADIAAIERVMEMDGRVERDAHEAAVDAVEAVSVSEGDTPPHAMTTYNGQTLREIYGTFGKFLSQFCFENGLTKRDLSKLIDASEQSICQWTSGKKIPRRDRAEGIAKSIEALSGNHYRASDILSLFW